MPPFISPVFFSLLLLFGMFVMLEIGRWYGRRRRLTHPDEEANIGTIEGSIFAVFGLILAFTFSGAATRFNDRQKLIAEEATTIGTAFLRVDLLTQDARPAMKELFRRYADSRLETYRRLPDIRAAEEELARTKKIQDEIWALAVADSTRPGVHPDAGKLLLPALNFMFDIRTTRTMAMRIHPPTIIYILLFVLGLICSVLAGYEMADSQKRHWVHILAFVLITIVTVYVVIDIEYPRGGLIRISEFDQVLVQERQAMDEH